LAYLLKDSGKKVFIVEARSRLGGRIMSSQPGPTEMGATWFGPKHQELVKTLAELKLAYYPQYQQGWGVFESEAGIIQHFNPENFSEPTYRIQGGSYELIRALGNALTFENIHLQTEINQITFQEHKVQLIDRAENQWEANKVVSTLPPKLLFESIAFHHELDEELPSVAKHTHTWMGESIKFSLLYAEPFWRNRGYAGTYFSQRGIVTEMYDHTNFERNIFALKGFIQPEAIALSPEERERRVIQQIAAAFGKEAQELQKYEEKIWANDPFTLKEEQSALIPHQNNGHPLLQRPYDDGRFYLSGTETASQFGGYMEGALLAARQTYALLEQSFQA
ncbi:MAG: FAD-dependent oxidoreductase, partial [Bacteroidota bacterium]